MERAQAWIQMPYSRHHYFVFSASIGFPWCHNRLIRYLLPWGTMGTVDSLGVIGAQNLRILDASGVRSGVVCVLGDLGA